MAEEIIGLKVELDTSGASAPMASLKSQIKEATNELVNFTGKFGATSKEAINAAKRVAELKDRLGDARQMVDAFNPDAKFNALTQSIQGAAGAFSAVQGAMGLFGVESANTEKALLKVQSAMAFSQGLSNFLDDGIEGFRNLYRTISGPVIAGFTALKAAIGSLGIGLLVVALGTLIANWDKISKTISGVSAEQEKLANQQIKLNEAIKSAVESISKEIGQLNTLYAATQNQNLSTEDRKKAIDKLQELYPKYFKNLSDETIMAGNAAEAYNNVNKALQNKAMFEAFSSQVTEIAKVMAPLQMELNTLDDKLKSINKSNQITNKQGYTVSIVTTESKVLEADIEDQRQRLLAKISPLQMQMNELSKNANKYIASSFDLEKENEKKKETIKKAAEKKDEIKKPKMDVDFADSLNDELEVIKNRNDIEVAFLEDKEAKKQAIIDAAENERAKTLAESIMEADEKMQAQAKLEIETAKLVAEAKKEIQDSTFMALEGGIKLVSDLFGKSKAVQAAALIADSAVGIAKIIVNTQTANAAVTAKYALVPGGPALAATEITLNKINEGIGIAANIAATAKGLSALNSGGTPSGAGSAGGAAPNAPSATVFNTTTKLNKDSIDKINDKAVKAYVVETDINNGQKRIERILINTKFK